MTVSQRLASSALQLGLMCSEVRGDKRLRALVTERAGLEQRVRADVWRRALELMGEEIDRAARAHSGRGRCKRCGDPVRWVITKSGKNMPLNPMPSPNGNVVLVQATGGKGTVAQVVPNSSLPVHGTPAYRSHYASCPFADQFRKRRAEKAAAPTCPTCDYPMAPWLLEHGYTTHPTCEER